MLLTNAEQTPTQYFIKLSNGQELGPYGSAEQARLSASTLPLREGEIPPQIVPRTAGGQQFLFG